MKIVSTDGSSLSNPGPIGWAWADREGNFDCGGYSRGTNQIAELTALLQALQAFGNVPELLIESDSQYAINCASVWVHSWRRNGWRGANKKQVSNINLIRTISDEMIKRNDDVKFKWVKGHAGDPFNEKVDTLANSAAKKWQAGEEIGGIPEVALLDINSKLDQISLNENSLF
ncbi:MAG: ribonuclease HI [Bifidobacteriaceae bacterium]|jgi:ribonuclease HI|nr:ribonuclease HI [Bifidobacteriaceae bacterium]